MVKKITEIKSKAKRSAPVKHTGSSFDKTILLKDIRSILVQAKENAYRSVNYTILPGDNPTIGLLLCSEQNESVIKYSVLKESKHLFSSRYKLFLPSEKELKKELDRERLLIEQQIKRSKPKK